MTRFMHWRKMTWAVLLWTPATATAVLMISGGFVLTFLIWALGMIALTAIWFMSRPLWRMGHGARVRRLQPAVIPFKSAENLVVSR